MRLIIHSENPQKRLIKQAAEVIEGGGIVVYPTDSFYGLACALDNKTGLARIRAIRQINAEEANGSNKQHFMSLCCGDISQISNYTQVDNATFRILKKHLPGPYVCIFPVSANHKEKVKEIVDKKRKTLGIRLPNTPITRALLDALARPFLSTSLKLPESDYKDIADIADYYETIKDRVDLVIDGGACSNIPSTVLDFASNPIETVLVRSGAGAVDGAQ